MPRQDRGVHPIASLGIGGELVAEAQRLERGQLLRETPSRQAREPRAHGVGESPGFLRSPFQRAGLERPEPPGRGDVPATDTISQTVPLAQLPEVPGAWCVQ